MEYLLLSSLEYNLLPHKRVSVLYQYEFNETDLLYAMLMFLLSIDNIIT